MNTKLRNITHNCDFCVVGGGLAGMCAAIAAARHGLKVVLIQDRPMFGGNTSSEIRMWVCGAHGDNNRETGIMEEISLENLHRNPYRNFPVWDSVLFEMVKNEENITALLNCTCNDCEVEDDGIKNIVTWQMTTQTFHIVFAKYFADCSGDSILAPLTGAEYSMGREERSRYDESIAPVAADKKTMGNTCLIQARETPSKRDFIPPNWAYKFTEEELKNRFSGLRDPEENYWYLEIGGTRDTIHDAEEIRDELLPIAYGIWDYIKNSGKCDADNWELDWVGYLPGKRESRRYIGDYVMNQRDIAGGGKFDDVVAFGGWSMDDHHPDGIRTREPANIFHPAPSPFGIPYRSLYSRNINNLFFAGRNISVTHSAMSATRVMATCATIGQAVGTAAWIAKDFALTPRGVYEQKLKLLQQTLMEDDCYLPGCRKEASAIMKTAEITTDGKDASAIINGFDRKIGENENCWTGKVGNSIQIKFAKEECITEIAITLDSDLNRTTIGDETSIKNKNTVSNIPLDLKPVHTPTTLVKEMKIEYITSDGETKELAVVSDNYQRVVSLKVNQSCCGIKITPLSTHGCEEVRIFSVTIK